ncbi:MAG: acyl carrier protein [Mucilaginibacter sp.]|nr:acyl carrier protein [Mucilaginibacter sp.]
MNEELKAFVIKQSAVDDEEITPETQLANDLGVNGDDAIEFIIAYGKRFNVDVSKFMAADYFGPEGDVILPSLIRSITGKLKPRKKGLTVGHLEKGIKAGKLDENVISAATESL